MYLNRMFYRHLLGSFSIMSIGSFSSHVSLFSFLSESQIYWWEYSIEATLYFMFELYAIFISSRICLVKVVAPHSVQRVWNYKVLLVNIMWDSILIFLFSLLCQTLDWWQCLQVVPYFLVPFAGNTLSILPTVTFDLSFMRLHFLETIYRQILLCWLSLFSLNLLGNVFWLWILKPFILKVITESYILIAVKLFGFFSVCFPIPCLFNYDSSMTYFFLVTSWMCIFLFSLKDTFKYLLYSWQVTMHSFRLFWDQKFSLSSMTNYVFQLWLYQLYKKYLKVSFRLKRKTHVHKVARKNSLKMVIKSYRKTNT